MFKTICNLVVCLLLFFSSLAHAQSETGDRGGGSGQGSEASRVNNVNNLLAMFNGDREMMAIVQASLSSVLSPGSAGVGTSAVPVHLTPRQPLDAMSGSSAGGGTSGEPVHAMSDIYGIE